MSNKKKARIAGLLYLGVVLTGLFSLMYVPSKLIVWDNAATTYANIEAAQPLFRLGIVSGLACYLFFLFLPFSLYELLKPVDKRYALVMVVLAGISVPVFFVNMQNEFTVLSLMSGESYLSIFTKEQLQTQVMLHLNQYANGLMITHIFSGLWLFPFGYLVFKSGFLPRILGILLMLGCFGYLTNFLGHALWSDYSQIGISSYISLPASIGEIGICLWLLIMGAKEFPTIPN
ncbi:DUF4386 domain-containing protein [Spirosoma spitsbergense]|uniref:DUF4386 domain-containing protein n=1 Tax=Spirosoma spitsbergense TaxID=431554 RepID=UPI000371572B|nr:DUF4386 domain-containing protein [Spirosoma spitsbergense]